MKSLHKCEGNGFILIALLVIINIMGLSLSMYGRYWKTVIKREKEKELLFRGTQIIKAIGNYYENSSGTYKRFPVSLDDLLKDPRFLKTTRYLRKKYNDPISGNSEWGIVTDKKGGIKGIYSKSDAEPLKKGNFPDELSYFAGKRRYSDWKFIYKSQERGEQEAKGGELKK